MNPLELTRPRFPLHRRLSKKKIFCASHCEQLYIVEIPNHSMVLEIFKEKGQPPGGISTHAKIDKPTMDFRIDFNLVTFWLGGDRLPGTPSAILGNFIFCCAHMDELIASPLPLRLLNSAVNLWRLSLTRDKVGVKLKIGEAFIL